MPRYLSFHTLACLTRQGAEELIQRLLAAPGFVVRRAAVNLTEGKMLVEYDADLQILQEWLAREGFHHEWLMRVELETSEGKLTVPEVSQG